MSFSYGASAASTLDKIRLLSADTVQDTRFSNTDEDLTLLIEIQPNLFLAAADACEMIGTRRASRAFEYDTASNVQGGIRVDRRLQPRWWFDRAKALRERAVGALADGAEVIQSFAFDVDVYGLDDSDYLGDTC